LQDLRHLTADGDIYVAVVAVENRDGSCANFDEQGLVSDSNFDGDGVLVWSSVSEEELDREGEPVALECLIRPLFAHERQTPTSELADDCVEIAAATRQAEECRCNRRWCLLARNDADPLELLQAVCEQVGCDPRQAVSQVRVAAWPAQEQLAHDQQRPALAEDVKAFGDGAVLVVGADEEILAVA
jgi:hypothetical protein